MSAEPAERRARIVTLNDSGTRALLAGRPDEAARHYEAAVRQLTAADDDVAADLFENLGLAYVARQRALPALRAFLRALDGDPAGRPQAARFAVTCLVNAHRRADAARYLARYEEAFGPHPDGWTTATIDGV